MNAATDVRSSDLSKRMDPETLAQIRSGELESRDSIETLDWASARFHPRWRSPAPSEIPREWC
jgi:hypothetical protein